MARRYFDFDHSVAGFSPIAFLLTREHESLFSSFTSLMSRCSWIKKLRQRKRRPFLRPVVGIERVLQVDRMLQMSPVSPNEWPNSHVQAVLAARTCALWAYGFSMPLLGTLVAPLDRSLPVNRALHDYISSVRKVFHLRWARISRIACNADALSRCVRGVRCMSVREYERGRSLRSPLPCA